MHDGEERGIFLADKDLQLKYLKDCLNMFLQVIDSFNQESANLEDIDRFIQMIDDLEAKHEQLKKTGKKPLAV
jgi:hypothetical protein